MRKTLAAAAAIALLFTVPAAAETVDMATVKCSDLANMKDDEANFMFSWLLGYAGGQASDTTIDLSMMDSIGKSIGEYCAANPDVGLVSAVTNVLSE
jgi:acid stress chaperone HdeB